MQKLSITPIEDSVRISDTYKEVVSAFPKQIVLYPEQETSAGSGTFSTGRREYFFGGFFELRCTLCGC